MSKTVLITGSSSGIGEETAKYFLEEGWNVSATMRTPENAGEWTKTNTNKIICPYLDVTNPESIKSAIQETIERFGTIDVLVNNAGYALMGPIEGITSEQLEKQFQTNFFGLVSTIQAILPTFRAQRSGTIINIASIGGRLAFPLLSSYNATKWALEGFSEALSYELESFGIRIKIIEPGGIKTNFINRGIVWMNHPGYENMIDRIKEFNKRMENYMAEPRGVAKTIYKAANDRSQRLRFSPSGEIFFLLHSILPDCAWRALIKYLMLGT